MTLYLWVKPSMLHALPVSPTAFAHTPCRMQVLIPADQKLQEKQIIFMLPCSILVAEKERHLRSQCPYQQVCTAARGTTFPRHVNKEELISVKGTEPKIPHEEQEGSRFLMRHISAATSDGHCLVIKLKH